MSYALRTLLPRYLDRERTPLPLASLPAPAAHSATSTQLSEPHWDGTDTDNVPTVPPPTQSPPDASLLATSVDAAAYMADMRLCEKTAAACLREGFLALGLRAMRRRCVQGEQAGGQHCCRGCLRLTTCHLLPAHRCLCPCC